MPSSSTTRMVLRVCDHTTEVVGYKYVVVFDDAVEICRLAISMTTRLSKCAARKSKCGYVRCLDAANSTLIRNPGMKYQQ